MIADLYSGIDHKTTEEALRACDERFRRYFELGLIGMAITSASKGFVETNDEFCRMLGYERDQLIQKTWAEMTHPEDLSADVEQFNRVMAGEIEGYSIDKRWIQRDGRLISTVTSAKCMRRPDGSVDYFVGLVMDITALKLAQHELKKAYDEIHALKDRLTHEKRHLEEEIRSDQGFADIVGQSTALLAILGQVETVAPTNASVLIVGETGTGKELIARAIHGRSRRHEGPFVRVNCAAIPDGLLESELFGHEKGAFTGAVAQRIGRFERAHQGTIFLDEIGEVPLELQVKLLRVLQEREFERVGGSLTIHVDVRIVAATNRDLKKLVAEHTFRDDLFYRLSVFPIAIPPLRDREGDIPGLVRHFVTKHAACLNRSVPQVSPESMAALCAYSWPGNIRELENLMERSVILSGSAALNVPLIELRPTEAGNQVAIVANARSLRQMQLDHILSALSDCKWVVGGPSGAAARLGMKRTSLQYTMQRLGITRPQ